MYNVHVLHVCILQKHTPAQVSIFMLTQCTCIIISIMQYSYSCTSTACMYKYMYMYNVDVHCKCTNLYIYMYNVLYTCTCILACKRNDNFLLTFLLNGNFNGSLNFIHALAQMLAVNKRQYPNVGD